MSDTPTIGRIAFGMNVDGNGQPIPRTVRVIKAKDRSGDIYIERHELSMLSLLVRKYPERASEFLKKCRLTHATEKA